MRRAVLAALDLAADRRRERVDVLLGGVERAHPAHLPGGRVPVVEPEGLAEAVRGARRQCREDRVGLGLLGDVPSGSMLNAYRKMISVPEGGAIVITAVPAVPAGAPEAAAPPITE